MHIDEKRGEGLRTFWKDVRKEKKDIRWRGGRETRKDFGRAQIIRNVEGPLLKQSLNFVLVL